MAKKFFAGNYDGDLGWEDNNSDFHLEISSMEVQFPDDSSKLFKGLRGEITIHPQIDTSNVINMSQIFARTEKANPNISNWDTSSLTDILRMFSRAAVVTELDLTNWDTAKIARGDQMFSGMSGLRFLEFKGLPANVFGP